MESNKTFPRPVYAFGNPESARETDPDAAQVTGVGLWRGMLYELQNLQITLAGSLDVSQQGTWNVGVDIGGAAADAGTGASSAHTLRTVSATDDPAAVSLAIIDDWDESDRAKVNVIAGQAGITAGAGAVSANTPRVTHASDDPLVTEVGPTNETAPASDTATSGLNGRLQRIAQRITSFIALIPSALTGSGNFKVSIQEQFASIFVYPISGQPTGVAGGAGAVSAITQRMTLASDDPAVAALGATSGAAVITDANGTIQQYLRGLIKQWIAGTLVIGSGTNTIGKTYGAYQTTKALTNANVSISSSGENTVVSGTASQTIRVFKLVLVAASAVTLTIKDAAGGTTLATIPLLAGGSLNISSENGEPEWVTATAGAFVISLSAAVSVTGYVQYIKS